MSTKTTGDLGEDVAVEYLEKNGFRILERNFIQRFAGAPQSAEIDIVAKKEDTISFIEVKTVVAKGESGWSPEEKVNFQKQRKIMRAAETWWLSKHKIDFDVPMQLDIIAVAIDPVTQKASIRYLPDIG